MRAAAKAEADKPPEKMKQAPVRRITRHPLSAGVKRLKGTDGKAKQPALALTTELLRTFDRENPPQKLTMCGVASAPTGSVAGTHKTKRRKGIEKECSYCQSTSCECNLTFVCGNYNTIYENLDALATAAKTDAKVKKQFDFADQVRRNATANALSLQFARKNVEMDENVQCQFIPRDVLAWSKHDFNTRFKHSHEGNFPLEACPLPPDHKGTRKTFRGVLTIDDSQPTMRYRRLYSQGSTKTDLLVTPQTTLRPSQADDVFKVTQEDYMDKKFLQRVRNVSRTTSEVEEYYATGGHHKEGARQKEPAGDEENGESEIQSNPESIEPEESERPGASTPTPAIKALSVRSPSIMGARSEAGSLVTVLGPSNKSPAQKQTDAEAVKLAGSFHGAKCKQMGDALDIAKVFAGGPWKTDTRWAEDAAMKALNADEPVGKDLLDKCKAIRAASNLTCILIEESKNFEMMIEHVEVFVCLFL